MRKSRSPADVICKLFNEKKIAVLGELKQALDTQSTMTVYRWLLKRGYLASFSHRGQYYTLRNLPQFDDNGLWSYRGVMFSRYGNLLETARLLVENSDFGFTARELGEQLGMDVKHPLLKLHRRKKICRIKLTGHYIYFSIDPESRRQQTLMRKQGEVNVEVGGGLDKEEASAELKAAIILFFSLLNEKQRRLYAGLEAARLGHGGDRKMADLLNLDPHTVAKGKREIFGGSVDKQRVRNAGGGAIELKKNARDNRCDS